MVNSVATLAAQTDPNYGTNGTWNITKTNTDNGKLTLYPIGASTSVISIVVPSDTKNPLNSTESVIFRSLLIQMGYLDLDITYIQIKEHK